MKSKKRFCIVTVNRNHGAYLSQTIESVLSNLRPEDEYFVVDGGSHDNSVNVILKYRRWLTGWCSESDSGYAEALHKGFGRVTGDYMCWINSGDILLDGSLVVAAEELEDYETEMIFGDDFYIDEQGEILFKSSGKVPSLKEAMLFGGWTPLQDACFWKRSLYEHVGGIDPRLKYAADYDLFLRFALHGKCRYVPSVFSAFRRHAGQKSILGAHEYVQEREACRARELRRLGVRGIRRFRLESYHRAWIRSRLYLERFKRLTRNRPPNGKARTLSVDRR